MSEKAAIPNLAQLEYQIYSSNILNVVSRRNAFPNMLEAALQAAKALRAKGEKDFEIHIEVGNAPNLNSHEHLASVARQAYLNFLAMAKYCLVRRLAVNELDEQQKFSICVGAGVPLITEQGNGYILATRTARPCAIILGEDCYHVYVQKEKPLA